MKLSGIVQNVALLGAGLDQKEAYPELKDREVRIQLQRLDGCLTGGVITLVLPAHLSTAYKPGRHVDIDIVPKK